MAFPDQLNSFIFMYSIKFWTNFISNHFLNRIRWRKNQWLSLKHIFELYHSKVIEMNMWYMTILCIYLNVKFWRFKWDNPFLESSSQCFSDEVSQKYQIFTVLNWTTSQLAKMTSVLECIDHLINGEVSSQLY